MSSSLSAHILASSTWKIEETAKSPENKPTYAKIWANATSKQEILDKLKDMCRNSEYVHVAARYCKYKVGGTYFCKKEWKCKKSELGSSCRGSVYHLCEFDKTDIATGQNKTTTINILLEKQEKPDDISQTSEASDTTEVSSNLVCLRIVGYCHIYIY